jgi:glutamate synthase (ferredoxin)
VATQKEDLRKKFPGTPGEIVQYFSYVATEVRMLLAHMGYKSLDELIGRGDLLIRKTGDEFKPSKTDHVNLDAITTMLPNTKEDRAWLQHPKEPHSTTTLMDDVELLSNQDVRSVIESNSPEVTATLDGTESILADNEYRSTGARLSGAIAARYGNHGFQGKLTLHLHGYVGQSFGAFNIQGVNWIVEGEANDYLGKSMNGGEIILKPSQTFQDEQASKSLYVGDNIILGNTALYGATGGKLFAYGGAGERFGVRNSGCVTVVENVGDHACEYMTGGVVVCLGKTGKNIGAGMTGGLGFFYDDAAKNAPEAFERRVNKDVRIGPLCSSAGQAYLQDLLSEHWVKTRSEKAKYILENWKDEVNKFRQIVPPSEETSLYVTSDMPDSAECSPSVAAGQKVTQTVR